MWTRLLERRGVALRIAEPTYVAHVEPGVQRVSVRGLEGARRYLEKHGSRMNARQRKSHLLKILMLEQRRMTPAAAADLLTRDTWRSVARYFVTSNVPALRRLGERYRRWRWAPPAQSSDRPAE
jgi:hypothetical protein